MKRSLICLLMVTLLAGLAGGAAQAEGERELYEFTLMQNFSGDMQDFVRAYFDKLEAELNLKINFQIPASSNYEESLQIMLASGDYPDAVLFLDHTKPAFQDAVKNGLITSITPYLDAYGQNIVAHSYPISLDTLKTNGDDDIFGIPRTSISRADGLCVRKDWADNLGLDLPEAGESLTRDQFTEILRAFTYDDPDGNGQKDTFGLSLASTGGVLSVQSQIAWSFGLIGWQELDGAYVDLQYSKDHDNYKQALSYMNMLWTEGYLDPDWPSITTEVAQQRLEAGIYGVQTNFAGHTASYTASAQKVNPDAEFIWYAGIQNDDGEVVGSSFSTGLWGFTCIMSSAEKPERIVEMYDYMLSDEGWPDVVYGLEGITWEYDADGNMVLADDSINISSSWQRSMVRRSTDPSFFAGLEIPPAERAAVAERIQISIDNCRFALDAGFTPPSSLELEFVDMRSEYDKVVTKIIVGDLAVDAYDDLLDEYYDAGYAKVRDEIIAHIEATK